jgi:hypothetical protein
LAAICRRQRRTEYAVPGTQYGFTDRALLESDDFSTVWCFDHEKKRLKLVTLGGLSKRLEARFELDEGE